MLARAEWCSVRLRFSAEEIALLRGVEILHGESLSREPSAAKLRDALAMMKAAHRITAAQDRAVVALSPAETVILIEGVRYTLQQLERYHDYVMGWQAGRALLPEQVELLERSFPEGRGSAWQTLRLIRALQALAARLQAPLGKS